MEKVKKNPFDTDAMKNQPELNETEDDDGKLKNWKMSPMTLMETDLMKLNRRK